LYQARAISSQCIGDQAIKLQMSVSGFKGLYLATAAIYLRPSSNSGFDAVAVGIVVECTIIANTLYSHVYWMWPWSHKRIWRNNIGPLDATRMAMAIATRTGTITISSAAASTKSSADLVCNPIGGLSIRLSSVCICHHVTISRVPPAPFTINLIRYRRS
jgi:hypothetical protein